MHLLIDGQALQTSSSRRRGIGRYSSNLLRALAVARPGWRIEVVQNSALPSAAADDLRGLSVLSFQPPLRPDDERCELNERFYADWLTARGADAVLLLSHCEGWEAVVPTFCGSRPCVFGIAYDLIPLLYPEHYLGETTAVRWYAQRFRQLLSSDALLAISEATARDVRTLGGNDAPLVVNIAGAVDPLFAPLSPGELATRTAQVRRRFHLPGDFLLYVGAADHRKNLHGALRAFGTLPHDVRNSLDLAVVCRMKASERAAFEKTAQQVGVLSRLKWIGSADDEELRALYQMCRLFFFPSLYEGLGLPVLEALHCGAPVVTSDCSSLPEYAGPVSWLGDADCPEAMAVVLQRALAEPRDARRAEREAFARTFSWHRTAERACVAMERTVNRRTVRVRRRRRLAWVLPLTSHTRGLSRRAAAMLSLLDDRFDIELVAASAPIEPPEELSRRYLILTVEEAIARHEALPYDLFLHQPAPPPRHQDVLDLAWQFPGLVVLPDFFLGEMRSLIESMASPLQSFDAAEKDEETTVSAFSPILGVIAHTASAWEQSRGMLNVPVIHAAGFDADSLTHGAAAESLVATYVGCIEMAICRQEQSDGVWRSFAVQALADSDGRAGAVIESWASLRAQGQRHSSRSRRPVEFCSSLGRGTVTPHQHPARERTKA